MSTFPEYMQYMYNTPDPTDIVSKNLDRYRNIQKQKLEMQILEDNQKKANIMRQELANFVELPNPSAKDYTDIMLKVPSLSKQLKTSYDMQSNEQQKEDTNTASQVYSAVTSGNLDVAKNILTDKFEAAKNSGLTKQAVMYKTYLNLLDSSPETFKTTVGLYLASTLPVEQYSKIFDKVQPSTYRVMTDKEKTNLGLPVDKPFQISPTGKITPVGDGSGVTVNLNEGESFGTIPQGYKLVKNEDGSYSMNPVTGSPADQEQKALAKQEQGSQREKQQTGNIVVQNIEKLKDKITNSPWYAPVAGIVASKIPEIFAQNRVDAEKLVSTIRANIGFDKLQRMREASPTGGALGQVSDRELVFLQSVLGDLSLSQSEKQLISNLDRLEKVYNGILKKAGAYPNAKDYGFAPEGKQQQKTDTKDTDVPPSDETEEDIYKRYGL